MSKPKLTPWYPPEVKPVREGCYETEKTSSGATFRYWNGYFWEICASYPSRIFPWGKSGVQHTKWRGLTEGSK